MSDDKKTPAKPVQMPRLRPRFGDFIRGYDTVDDGIYRARRHVEETSDRLTLSTYNGTPRELVFE